MYKSIKQYPFVKPLSFADAVQLLNERKSAHTGGFAEAVRSLNVKQPELLNTGGLAEALRSYRESQKNKDE